MTVSTLAEKDERYHEWLEFALKKAKSDNWLDRLIGATVLGRIGGRKAVDELLQMVSERERKEDSAVLKEVVEALGLIGGAEALPALEEISAWPDPLSLGEETVRDTALEAVKEMKWGSAVSRPE
ncbi:MAG: HEAT repeat domain-containing protein [Candidatus Dormibacteria bacterium]